MNHDLNHDPNSEIAEMLGMNPADAPDWAGDIRHAWRLMEAMNATDSPVDWQIFREKLLYEFGMPIGHPEEDACGNICRAILASRKKSD